MKNLIPLTPELRAALQNIEVRKQFLMEGYLMAHGVTEGAWEISGDTLIRTDILMPAQPQPPQE